MRVNAIGRKRAAALGVVALTWACGGRPEVGDGGIGRDAAGNGTAPPGAPAPGGTEAPPSNDGSSMTGEGAGGAGNEPPENIGNIGGAQFMVATRCDACGWRRSDERCLDLVSSMPFVGDPSYYPCLDASLTFASCVEGDGDLCETGQTSSCSQQQRAIESCF